MDNKEMEKRLQALEDLEAIKKLHQEYILCLDNIQFSKALELFTDDAEVEVRNSGVMKGRENFSKIYMGTLAMRKERHDAHLASHPDIIVEGDKARGRWTIYMFFSVPTVEWVQGRNDCEYTKVNGKWKISKLKFTRTLASKPELYP
jgi:ketosteroid isomerase-like protein